MTKTRYFVTASVSPDGGPPLTAWLLGPFQTSKGAWSMVPPVMRACRVYMGPAYTHATVTVTGTAKRHRGSLSLSLVVDQEWTDWVISKS